jgi:hypothetical protein
VEDEIVCNVADGQVIGMPSTTLKNIGFKERADLQKWIEGHPEIVERNLLMVTTEFNQWGLRTQRVEDRLDVLLLVSDGAPVVAEPKRGEAHDTVDLQALEYAAYYPATIRYGN